MAVPSCLSFSIRLAGVALATMLLLGTYGKDATSDVEAAQQAVDPSLVVAQPTLVQHLKVASVDKQPTIERLRVSRQIAPDEQHATRIGAIVTGCVTESVATPGQSVRTGDIPAQLHSTEFGAAQLAYQKAVAQHDLQARALGRIKLLLVVDVTDSAELQKRQSELAMANTEVRATVDQLRVMGVSSGMLVKMRTSGMSSISPVVASISDTMVERKVTRGQIVQPADELFTVTDLLRVQVVGEMLEDTAAGVRTGQAVEIDTSADDRIVGKLVWVSDIIGPQTRTVTTHTGVDNAGRTLRLSMLATLLIQSRPKECVVVPTSAVVCEDNRDYVFMHTSEMDHQLTPVRLGDELNGVHPVIPGVRAGQPIVVEGGSHLNNEHKRAEMEDT